VRAAMSDRGGPDDLRSLGERLDKARRDRMGTAAGDGTGKGALDGSALGFGFRIGIELVVAVVFGLGVGWAFDRALGTKPWGLIVFLLMGIAAGMLNVFRAMRGMGSAIGYGGLGQGPASSADNEEED
jgi:ATP synthase protein I